MNPGGACRGNNSVHCRDHASHHAIGSRCQEEPSGNAHERTDHAHQERFAQKHPVDVSLLDAHGAQNADFFPALIHRDGEGIEDDVDTHEQRHETRDQDSHAHRGDRVFERLPADFRAIHFHSGWKLGAQSLLHDFHGNARGVHQVNAVKLSAAMKNNLRGVDIHHRDVAAKNFSDADRFECSLDGEILFSIGSEKRKFIADLQAVAIGKGARKQNGIGLREKDKRIGDLRLRAVELIIPKLLISRGVHSENQQSAFVRKRSLHHGLDHGFSKLHAGCGANRVEHFFGKTGFSGGNLQRRFSRELLHRGVQGIKQSGIAGANCEKNGDSEGDAESG